MKKIYLDYASSTPIDKKVSKAMQKAEELAWANPSSLHAEGEKSRAMLIKAREEIARVLHCREAEIYFTSGGTESANIAVQGVINGALERGITPHIIVSSIEHPAVLEPVKKLLKEGKIEVSYINPNEDGLINPESIKKEIRENTVLVCIMHANNEVGTIQPVGRIGSFIKEYRKNKKLDRREPLLAYPYLFVDASQSALYEDVSPERLSADIVVVDGIKMYGPRGAGVLAVKHGVGIAPIVFGGGQEKGLRSGTENVVSAVGLAEAMKIAEEKRKKESERLTAIRDVAIHKILTDIPGSSLNGDQKQRLPNNINICLASPKSQTKVGDNKIDSEFLVIKLDTLGFSVSSASACQSLNLENSSYVIESLGKPECASSSLRFTLGRETKKSDLDALIKTLKKIVVK